MTNLMVEQAHFYLSPEKWDEFCAALDAPPKDLPALRKLLAEPSVFDEPKYLLMKDVRALV